MMSLLRIGALALSLFTSAAFAGATAWMDFTLENGHVKIPVTLAGIETHAMLDTGAQINGINKAFVMKHELDLPRGAKTRVKGVFGIEDKTTYNNVPLTLFGVETELDSLVESRLGMHTTGLLLGAGFFQQFIVQIDYPNQRMRLVTRDSLDMSDIENIEMRAQRGTGQPMVRVGLGKERSAWLLFDTGNSGGVLIKRIKAKSLGWLDGESTHELASGVNTVAMTESVRVDEFQFGPFTMDNVLVTVPAEGQSANLEHQYSRTGSNIRSQRIEGILGYDILKHFVITIDYKYGHAHIGLPEES